MESTRPQEATAFGAGLERESAGLRSFLRRALGPDRDSREDALQETLLRAWRYRAAFQLDRPLGPWLLTIAARVVRDRRPPPVIESSEPVDPHGTDPLDAAMLDEERLRLERARESLPEVVREVFDSFYVEQRSVAEIAARTHLPVGTVKSHLHRARVRLRRELERPPRRLLEERP